MASGPFIRQFSHMNIAGGDDEDDLTCPAPTGMRKRNRPLYGLSEPIVPLPLGNVPGLRYSRSNIGKPRRVEPWKLRMTYPDWIPVIMDRDASSYYPDITVKKYLVEGDTALREFVDFISKDVWLVGWPPMHLYFKKTVPATGALMSQVDQENKDQDDGFLHITYSGDKKEGAWAYSCLPRSSKRSISSDQSLS